MDGPPVLTDGFKGSILRRPVRPGQANLENLDREYEKEQQRIAAKAAVLEQHQDRLLRAYYASDADKRRLW
jgi:hypothetical protein